MTAPTPEVRRAQRLLHKIDNDVRMISKRQEDLRQVRLKSFKQFRKVFTNNENTVMPQKLPKEMGSRKIINSGPVPIKKILLDTCFKQSDWLLKMLQPIRVLQN